MVVAVAVVLRYRFPSPLLRTRDRLGLLQVSVVAMPLFFRRLPIFRLSLFRALVAVVDSRILLRLLPSSRPLSVWVLSLLLFSSTVLVLPVAAVGFPILLRLIPSPRPWAVVCRIPITFFDFCRCLLHLIFNPNLRDRIASLRRLFSDDVLHLYLFLFSFLLLLHLGRPLSV